MKGNNNYSKFLFLWPPAHSLPSLAPPPTPPGSSIGSELTQTAGFPKGDSSSASGAVRGFNLCLQGHMEPSSAAFPWGVFGASVSPSEYGHDNSGAQMGSFFFKSTHLLT